MIESNNDSNVDDNNDENQITDLERNETGSDSKRSNKRKQTFERKNIRNIIDDQKFGKDAKEAQKAEYERLKRVQEKEQNIKVQNLLTDDFKLTPNHIFQPSNFNQSSIANNFIKIYPSLQPETSGLSAGMRYKRNNFSSKQYRMVPDNCVIFLDESDEERERRQPENKVEVIEISDGEDDDDNIEDNIDQEQADINNFDRDDHGNILINVAHSKDEDDFFLSDKISRNIKPHQVSGIRFLYENLVESRKQFKEADGFGCILAHSMGLGKTIQIIGFLDILFRCCDARSTLVIVPINTLQNWQAEIENWLPTNEMTPSGINGTDSIGQMKKEQQTTNQRSFRMFVIKDCHKTIESRHSVIRDWTNQGGVLLIGYEMFRLLVTYRQNKVVKPKKKDRESVSTLQKKKTFIDADLEERRNSIYQDFLKALVNPGPEVIICDEGHRIKNSEASISKALKAVRTHRRVVMTGYPLQNNLTEYWCMVDFVRPNYLGSKHEFNNMFQRPIENGQCVDSTVEDRKLMQGRAHVLHELLQGFVQRRSHAVLKANLPPKWEYVIMIKMSPIQRKLYSSFMEQLFSGNLYSWSQNSTLKIYAMCCKIWNHPDILFRVLQEKLLSLSDPDFDFDIEEEVNSTPRTNSSSSMSRTSSNRQRSKASTSCSSHIDDSVETDNTPKDNTTDSDTNVNINSNSKVPPATVMSYSAYLEMLTRKVTADSDNPYSWINEDSWRCGDDRSEYSPGCKEHSGKIVVFMSLLDDCISYGDRMLVFSQSLLTLDIIEMFLKQSVIADGIGWEKNKTYFRLDGSTSASERERMINSFNEPNSCAHLFLLSTRAGCLGINLVGANRVVVFDASWNPCHDCQAVCRVYRYGQTKPCFIYRLVTDNTMEKKIYDRQVTKQGISDRVVDESNPGQHFLRSQVQVLIDYDDMRLSSALSGRQIDEIKNGCGEEDPILGRVLVKHAEWITKVPFTHESLLIDRKDYRLTKREKRKAKESYERDKRQSLYYQKNSYSDLYTKSIVPISDGYNVPPRPPIPPYRSSIIPNLSNNSHTLTPNFPSIYNNRFKVDRNIIRPPIMSKQNSALMREIVEAQMRCGLQHNTPFPIAVSDDEDDVIVVRKKPKESVGPDSSTMRRQRELLSRLSDYPTEDVAQKAVALKPPTEIDNQIEQRTDSNFKVIRITATTDLTFPGTPTISTSHISPSNPTSNSTTIRTGEPLEVIYTNKGKFLRVPRTSDLYAIKDNKERSSSLPLPPSAPCLVDSCVQKPPPETVTATIAPPPSQQQSPKNPYYQYKSTSSSSSSSCFAAAAAASSAAANTFASISDLSPPRASIDSTPTALLENRNDGDQSPLAVAVNNDPQKIQFTCCNCPKFSDNTFIIGCACLCHSIVSTATATAMFPLATVYHQSSHLAANGNPQPIFIDQSQQQKLQYNAMSPFLLSLISTPVVVNGNQWIQGPSQFPEQFTGSGNVTIPANGSTLFSAATAATATAATFEFSDL